MNLSKAIYTALIIFGVYQFSNALHSSLPNLEYWMCLIISSVSFICAAGYRIYRDDYKFYKDEVFELEFEIKDSEKKLNKIEQSLVKYEDNINDLTNQNKELVSELEKTVNVNSETLQALQEVEQMLTKKEAKIKDLKLEISNMSSINTKDMQLAAIDRFQSYDKARKGVARAKGDKKSQLEDIINEFEIDYPELTQA